MPYAQNSAAYPMRVRHLSGPVTAIPAASAGVLPSRPPCGRMKLWYMISRRSRAGSMDLNPRMRATRSLISPLRRSYGLFVASVVQKVTP